MGNQTPSCSSCKINCIDYMTESYEEEEHQQHQNVDPL